MGPVPQITRRVSGCMRITSFIASMRSTLPGEWMQPLDVQQQMRVVNIERLAHGELIVRIVPGEGLAHGGVDRARPLSPEPEILRLQHQPVTVERYRRRSLERLGEEVRRYFLG